MKNVGNVTNNMTFMNTHLLDGTIQSEAKGLLRLKTDRTLVGFLQILE